MVIYMGSMLGDSFNKVPTKKMKKKKKSKQYETNICLLELKILKKYFKNISRHDLITNKHF